MASRGRTTLIMDCDPGLDDAVAMALAAAAPEIAIEAITTAAGNADIARVTDNALSLAASLALKSPVYAGAAAPLRVKAHFGTQIWGGDGALGLKRPRRGALTETAAEFLTRRLEESEEASLTLCMLAPLTNLALVLMKRPQLATRVKQLLFMGGALGAGNATRIAEMNVWFDPHAAACVLTSPIPMVIMPLDVTRTVIPTDAHVKRLARAENPAAQLIAGLLANAGEGQPQALHDACVIGWMLWPELFTTQSGRLGVNASVGPARGQTRFVAGEGPHTLITGVDLAPFLDKLFWRLAAKGSSAK